MTFNEYQEKAARTRNPNILGFIALLEAALGLCGEVGEVVDLVKKNQFQGHELDAEKVCEELGDVFWYAAELATTLGITLDEVAETNIKKLAERYPDGFSAEASKERK